MTEKAKYDGHVILGPAAAVVFGIGEPPSSGFVLVLVLKIKWKQCQIKDSYLYDQSEGALTLMTYETR